MDSLYNFLNNFSQKPVAILDDVIALDKYTELDLSINNIELSNYDITDPEACQAYIDSVLHRNDALVAYGGYLEQRNLYNNKKGFSGLVDGKRNIHLGMDFWAKAGTKVRAPISGRIHSFKNNRSKGNYGPTIILSHNVEGVHFYTLYGHLSLESLNNLYEGKNIKEGDILGFLGTSDINVNYAPHLHFQMILNIGDYKGDYPGVCSSTNLEYYIKNCPDPNLLLHM
ncbi:MAG: peptidoglycan DD-metalloendopeptidase family protein [Bacteroidota bacterium]